MISLFGVVACDNILEVDDPDIITPDDLDGEFGLEVIHAGAIGDFKSAWTGGRSDGLVLTTGTLADEWVHAVPDATPLQGRRAVDERAIPIHDAGGEFANLQLARRALEAAAERISALAVDPASEPRVAEMHNLAGYTYLAFGENYCSGVPFSTAPETGDLQFGRPKTTSEIFEIAIERFDAALAQSGADAKMENLAHVGKSRALVNLGRVQEAAAEVANVPTSFQYVTEHSYYDENFVNFLNVERQLTSLADSEGVNGLPFRSADDPRIPWTETVSFRDGSPHFNLDKYPDVTTSLVLADGIEARLIEAEALLATSDVAAWLGILNQLRADAAMNVLTDPATDAARVDLLFSERAFWLFATGHRLGDLRRLVRQYGRDAESVFPTGPYFRGGTYGTDVNFPIPIEEQANPNFSGCLDRNP